MSILRQVVPSPGEVWDYIYYGHGRAGGRVRFAYDPLKVTRPGRREGDWLGYRLFPEWEEYGHEWLIAREQLRDGRYGRRPNFEDLTVDPAELPGAVTSLPRVPERQTA